MLVNLVPEFLAVLAAPDPPAAYHDYLDRHKPVLQSYWHNYVLDPTSPHAEQVIAATLRAERADLERLLEDVDVAAIAEDALQRSLERFEADCAVDLYLMVGVGAANAGELVVGGRGIAFVCLEHFTGRPNPQTYGMGLAPHLLPLWIAHEVAHAVRYTSPTSRADLKRLVTDLRGYYDYWDTGSRATLRSGGSPRRSARRQGSSGRRTSGRSGSKPHEPAAPRRAPPEPAAAGGPGRPARPRTRDRPPGEGDDAGGARLRAAAVGMARRRGVAGPHGGGTPAAGPRKAPLWRPGSRA